MGPRGGEEQEEQEEQEERGPARQVYPNFANRGAALAQGGLKKGEHSSSDSRQIWRDTSNPSRPRSVAQLAKFIQT